MRLAPLAALLVLGACRAPDFQVDRTTGRPTAGPERSDAGKLVANGTSSVVVAIEGRYVELQIGPATQVAIDGQVAAPRAVLPGTDVRVTWVPGDENRAVRIEADGATMGWSKDRDAPGRTQPGR
jgi:hypothetical protein